MKVAILGHFAESKNFCDGQTVKTRMLYDGFCNYSNYELVKIDSYNWKKHPLRLVMKIRKAVKSCENFIMLPASNGVKVFVPLVNFFNKKHKCKVFYCVIGAWLANVAKNKSGLVKNLKKLDGIWTETEVLKKELAELEIANVEVVENFKDIEAVRVNKQEIYEAEVKRFCTFSRVIKEKGISLAIETIAKINKEHSAGDNRKENSNITAKLDIYGPVGEDYKAEFFELVQKYSEFVEYKGVAEPSESATILSRYYCLLFPTFYRGECMPGSIIDSLFAGTPIVASSWSHVNGILDSSIAQIYDYDSREEGLYQGIQTMINIEQSAYLKMTESCYLKSEKYKTENIMVKIKSLVDM